MLIALVLFFSSLVLCIRANVNPEDGGGGCYCKLGKNRITCMAVEDLENELKTKAKHLVSIIV